jgi:hypothetical protein
VVGGDILVFQGEERKEIGCCSEVLENEYQRIDNLFIIESNETKES